MLMVVSPFARGLAATSLTNRPGQALIPRHHSVLPGALRSPGA
jgi:hypothetical protein